MRSLAIATARQIHAVRGDRRQRIVDARDWPAPSGTSYAKSYLATSFGLVTEPRVFRKLGEAVAPRFEVQSFGATNNGAEQILLVQWLDRSWEAEGSTHLELQWSGGEAVTLYFPHEPRPFVSLSELKKRDAKLEAHLARHEKFRAAIERDGTAFTAAGWKLSRRGGWALASWKVGEQDCTVAELRGRLGTLATAARRIVDAVAA